MTATGAMQFIGISDQIVNSSGSMGLPPRALIQILQYVLSTNKSVTSHVKPAIDRDNRQQDQRGRSDRADSAVDCLGPR